MVKTSWLCAAIATVAIGCAAQGTRSDDVDQPGGSGSAGSGPTSNDNGSGSTASGDCTVHAQPPGSIQWERTINGGTHVIVDTQGAVIYTTDPGIVKIDADGNRVFAFGFGDVVTADARGNIYVAGVLAQPITVGGTNYDPVNGNILIVELSPAGDVLFATQDLCNANMLPGETQVISIAVAGDGRIAISGGTIGVVVLDAQGLLVFQTPYAGHVAFDANGDLIVGMGFGGSGQLQLAPGVFLQGSADFSSTAIVRYDTSGNYVAHYELDQAAIEDLAIDATGHIAFIASFIDTMNLYGQTLSAPSALPFPEGAQAGAIAVRLDASFAVVWAEQINPFNLAVRTPAMFSAMGGLAVNAFGDLIVSSNFPTPTGVPYALPTLAQYSAPAGGVLLSEGARTTGFGLGVAEDACGNIYFASVQYTPNATTLLDKIVAER